jgi:hypothetical protein
MIWPHIFAPIHPWLTGFECRVMDIVLGVLIAVVAGVLVAWGVMV